MYILCLFLCILSLPDTKLEQKEKVDDRETQSEEWSKQDKIFM